MLGKSITVTLAAIGIAAAGPALAGTKTKQLICSASEAQECAPTSGCKRVSPGEINLPPMWYVNLEKKQLSAVTMEGKGRSETIEGVKDTDKAIYLYGLQDEEPWSAVISRENGIFSLGITAYGSSFSVFGVCAPK